MNTLIIIIIILTACYGLFVYIAINAKEVENNTENKKI